MISDEQISERANEVANLLVRVYEMHDDIINDTGGLPGLRDGASLHAAVARPFSSFDGKELYPNDFEKAAALFHSLIKSHPFMDGTKRTAFASALYFLESCGYSIPKQFSIDKIVEFCVSIAEENLLKSHDKDIVRRSIAEIAIWFQALLKV